MANVFISYNRQDDNVATRLAESLTTRGHTVFRDMNTLVSGEDFSNAITEAVSKADAVVVLLSSHSKRSSWVGRELRSALEQEKVILPILLDADAKNNWIWPLVSDRIGVTVDDRTDYKVLAERLEKAIVLEEKKTKEDQRNIVITGDSVSVVNAGNIQSSFNSIGVVAPEELRALLGELQKELASIPTERRGDADRVLMTTEMVISEYLKDSPNQSFLNSIADGLNKAAQTLTDIAPSIQAVVRHIVALVVKKA